MSYLKNLKKNKNLQLSIIKENYLRDKKFLLINNENNDKTELSDELGKLEFNYKISRENIKNQYKLEKKEHKLQKKVYSDDVKYKKKEINRKLNEAPKLSALEEIGNSISHGIGAILAIIALILMLIKSDNLIKIFASLIYGFSLFFMFLMSCLYHAFRWGKTVKRIWRRFDYSSIYLLIGGTFAPLLLVHLGGLLGIILTVIQWIIIITGITFVCIFGPGKLKWLNFSLYFVIGWSGLMFIPSWIKHNVSLLCYILGGGIVYTLGMIPFVKKGRKCAHFIWHIFVIFGAIVQWVGIYFFVY